ncbi:hypothetical protein GOFOIKOB_2452 [Methylobacterium tardum]|uniref:Uncharacterized protein n=1 Tax=Methylobacterium tardum TaxID=374432 RepID=A0AA37TCW0_9HYPH|nr:hypothetical protein [Methylobacterium tardum]GJE49416.1 hypothetical protein GOFOIKOB_2452 [Methylobacterium tardum]GLS68888.1 hypothetical protein GCM10007890_09000 [Methylobacterium tardum]
MGKPRRPRGSRSTWEAKPPREADAPVPTESHAEESAIETAAAPAVAAGTPETAPDPAPASAPIPEATEPQAALAEAALVEAAPTQETFETVAAAIPGTTPADEIAAKTVLAAAPEASGLAEPNRIAFAPDRLDVVEIGSTIARYVRGEGEAALAHLRALSGARTPADLIRLQVGEVQRAADASLTCWVTVVGKASRVVAFR